LVGTTLNGRSSQIDRKMIEKFCMEADIEIVLEIVLDEAKSVDDVNKLFSQIGNMLKLRSSNVNYIFFKISIVH